MKVLIIDDEPIVREGLKNIIDWNALGFTICGEAVNGIDGLDMIMASNPELVLLDIKMPKMNGIELAQEARKRGYKGKIIILSGYSDFGYAQDAIKFGVDSYLLKPVDEEELIEFVKSTKSKIEEETKLTMSFKISQQFFCKKNAKAMDMKDTKEQKSVTSYLYDFNSEYYVTRIYSCIEAGEVEKLDGILEKLEEDLSKVQITPEKAMGLLTSLCIQIGKKIQQNYLKEEQEFPNDTDIINEIYGKDYLYDVLNYLKSVFGRMTISIGNVYKHGVISKVLGYIDKNSSKDIKLESLAELFGYNSAYLGKVFKSYTGENFNAYLDRKRIDNAKALLLNRNLKVYEIHERVGYSSLDYFYKKFKKYVGESPKEYRRKTGIISDDID